MKCKNPNCIPFPPELPDRAGIGKLKGPCWKCGQYGDSETGELVLARDTLSYNPGRFDSKPIEEWTDDDLADAYAGIW